MNRRQALSTLLVTGAAGSLGVATAAPASAAPPASARLRQVFQDWEYTNLGLVNYQAVMGLFDTDSGAPAPARVNRIFWGVKLHNRSKRTQKVTYSSWRDIWTTSGGTTVQEGYHQWRLAPGQRALYWFGGPVLEKFAEGESYWASGQLQFPNGDGDWGDTDMTIATRSMLR